MRLKLIIAIALLPLLVGCVRFSLDTLNNAELSGTPYANAVAVEYRAFAQSEASQFDWWDAEKFAKKGLQAATGEDVQPEDPNEWDIPETALPALLDAREKLLSTVTTDVQNKEPELAARAMLVYDCLVEQQEENWQTEHIDACRNEFFDILDYLTAPKEVAVNVAPTRFEEVTPETGAGVDTANSTTAVKAADETEAQAAPEVGNVPAFIANASFVVFFEFNSTKLTKEAEGILDRVAESLKDQKGYEVALNGYSDRAGNAEYNLVLSRRRADIVRKALVQRGISKENIVLYSFGEDKLAVETKDGVKEKANRRVEVFIH